MKTNFVALLCMSSVAFVWPVYEFARPGQPYRFPSDHFNHPDYETEWWYYTGNLEDAEHHRYGFELTFFRQANHVPASDSADVALVWRPDQVYLAHLAFTDVAGHRFYHTERLNRAGPGLAGAEVGAIWNGNWHSRWQRPFDGSQQLQGITDTLGFELNLAPRKPFIVNGQNGISVKGPHAGEASHYVSFTRLAVTGAVQWSGRTFSVHGLAWMDHEYFTEPKNGQVAGWDWFSVQLNNNEELMLYRLRTRAGTVTQFSSGTYVDSSGKSRLLKASDFILTPFKKWTSPHSSAKYPVAWDVSVPAISLHLTETPLLLDQELVTGDGISTTYWEGAVGYMGTLRNANIAGSGYLELTGYKSAVTLTGAPISPE